MWTFLMWSYTTTIYILSSNRPTSKNPSQLFDTSHFFEIDILNRNKSLSPRDRWGNRETNFIILNLCIPKIPIFFFFLFCCFAKALRITYQLSGGDAHVFTPHGWVLLLSNELLLEFTKDMLDLCTTPEHMICGKKLSMNTKCHQFITWLLPQINCVTNQYKTLKPIILMCPCLFVCGLPRQVLSDLPPFRMACWKAVCYLKSCPKCDSHFLFN